MSGRGQKKIRMLEIFFRAMMGENISVKNLAMEYDVSSKSISRDISEIKNFLSESRDVVGNAELKYASNTKSYYLEFNNFLSSRELVFVIKILIGCRTLSKQEIRDLITKLRKFTSCSDQNMLNSIITKEMYHYREADHNCESIITNVWILTRCICKKNEITITYDEAGYDRIRSRVMPMTITCSEYCFYLLAYCCDESDRKLLRYRIDRIVNIVEHRNHFEIPQEYDFDGRLLYGRFPVTNPGGYRRIRFEYTGSSIQTILDEFPTARVIDVEGERRIVEAETLGTDVNMFLLSQGSRVKALYPQEFVNEMRCEIENMGNLYQE